MLFQLLTVLTILAPLQTEDPVAKYRQAAIARWEQEIQALEKLDRQQPDPAHGVLFLGSSSIRRWDTIVQDMAPYPVIQRGYGGAQFSDLAVFVERLVKPHQFDAAAIFVANDITGKADDKSPTEVMRLVKHIVAEVRDHQPSAAVFLIAVTPTRSRFQAWDDIQQLNTALDKYCQSQDYLHFIDTADQFLDSSGEPIDKYFVEDQLHLNREGYQVWSRIIKQAFNEVLPTPQ